jgi:hypothetical protein
MQELISVVVAVVDRESVWTVYLYSIISTRAAPPPNISRAHRSTRRSHRATSRVHQCTQRRRQLTSRPRLGTRRSRQRTYRARRSIHRSHQQRAVPAGDYTEPAGECAARDRPQLAGERAGAAGGVPAVCRRDVVRGEAVHAGVDHPAGHGLRVRLWRGLRLRPAVRTLLHRPDSMGGARVLRLNSYWQRNRR